MTPSVNPRDERRKQRGRAAGLISTATILASALFPSSWTWLGTDPSDWVLFAVSTVVVVAVVLSADLPHGRGRDGRRKGGVLTGRGDDGDSRPSGSAAYQWRRLKVVSRLMPGSAGRRWLAEAESLLAEIKPGRRGAAIRSYLVTAPWLVVTMWARAAQRRARPGPRRPG